MVDPNGFIRQLVTRCDRFKKLKHSSSLPNALTEHGAIMAASVLNSSRAIEASIYVVRASVKMRQFLSTQSQFAAKLLELEKRLEGHDSDIRDLILTIRDLTEPVLPEER